MACESLRNPYLLETPLVISFSGGRTSGYMLWHILQAFGGTLPVDVKVVFCNTGKERPETLDFVERCGKRWGVPIVWLEYRYEGQAMPSPNGVVRETPCRHTFAIVDYATASRNGEPFEQLIKARRMLPNPVSRFCTVEMKIRTSNRYVRSIGWTNGYTNAIGFRADEPRRVAKLATTNRHGKETAIAPMSRAGVSLADVRRFWSEQPFDLELEQHEGNCDLCFLKGAGKIQRMLRDRPDLAGWWVKMESLIPTKQNGTARFRSDRPRYAAQLKMSQESTLFDDAADDLLSASCSCTN
jgi:3'-phosphoadenosine 5'-phosphosulfate sulfotransferase (PAPS reductase)/FAD synthetase